MSAKGRAYDPLAATPEEIEAAVNRCVRAALRRHKRLGVPAIVWDRENERIVEVPPDEIPDFPEDDDGSEARPEPEPKPGPGPG